jgi:hypothetical protein
MRCERAHACAHRELFEAPTRASLRLNGYFELFVGPALFDLGPKFESATGNKLSRVSTLEDDAPECSFSSSRRGDAAGQFPARTDEMTGVAVRIAL